MKTDNYKFSITRKKHPLFLEPILVARYKSCEAHLEIFENELNIQFIESQEKNKGHATGLVKNLLAYAKEKELPLVSSVIISKEWLRISNRFGLKNYGDESN